MEAIGALPSTIGMPNVITGGIHKFIVNRCQNHSMDSAYITLFY